MEKNLPLRFFVPRADFVANIKPGDYAPDSFGNAAQVVTIAYRGIDVNGKAYVGVNLAFGDNATISESYKVDRLHRHIGICNLYTSAELDAIEKDMNARYYAAA